MEKDKSFRFRLPSELFDQAIEKARREDLTLAQVLRRFMVAWVNGAIKLPEPQPEKRKPKG